jgi:acyl carrier protein
VRGHRIELGEIEAHLQQHPAVQAACVVVRADDAEPQREQRIVAYIVPRGGVTVPHASELRSFLQARAPDYMLPTAYVQLAALPLTPNGKLDRRALPAPEPHQSSAESSYVAPQTELEQTIAALWQDVLEVERVGLHDNFFDLGGTSFSMFRVCNRLREDLNRPISMVEMFKHPTVHALTTYLSQPGQAPQSQRQGQQRAERRRNAQQRRRW